MKTDKANQRSRLRWLRPALGALLATALVACVPEDSESDTGKANPASGTKPAPAAPPDDAELRILAEQVERERTLRGEAEIRVASESGRREFWETLTVVTCMLAVVLFLVGTAIGSKGRSHAESL